MNITQTILLGMHNGDIGVGWLIVMVPMMLLMMGGMMWMMMRGMGSGSSSPSETSTTDKPTTESPVEVLERRFAEGEISVEEYRARREALVNGTAEPSADHDEEQLIGARGGEGRQS